MTIESAIPASPLSGSTSVPQRPPSGETFESVLLAALDAKSSGESADAALDSDALPAPHAMTGVGARADAAQAAADTASNLLNSIASMESSLGFSAPVTVLDGAVPSLPVGRDAPASTVDMRPAVAPLDSGSDARLSSDAGPATAPLLVPATAEDRPSDLVAPSDVDPGTSLLVPAHTTDYVPPVALPTPTSYRSATREAASASSAGQTVPLLPQGLPQAVSAGLPGTSSTSALTIETPVSVRSALEVPGVIPPASPEEAAPSAQPSTDGPEIGPPLAAQGAPAPQLAAAHLLTAGTGVPASQAPAAIAQVASSPGQIRIALSPEGLGSVLVQVTATADGVSVLVRASSEALNTIGRLAVIEALTSAGVNASRVEFVSLSAPQPSSAASDENASGSGSGDRSQREPSTPGSFEDGEAEPFVFELPDLEEQS